MIGLGLGGHDRVLKQGLASGSASTADHPLSPLSGESSTSSPAQAGVAAPAMTEETPPAPVSHAAPAGSLLGSDDSPETAYGAEFLGRVRALLTEPLGLAV